MKKKIVPLIVFFLIINGGVLAFKQRLFIKGIDTDVVIIGNLILFFATLLSGYMYFKSLNHNNPQAIMRSIYGGFMLKFFLLLIAALVYIALAKPINKPALFICMGLYLIYHFIGTKIVVRQKQKKSNVEGEISV